MVKDFLKTIRAILINDATIQSYVGSHIRISELPKARLTKQITLRKDYGISDSIIKIVNPTLFITVWIKQKENTEPYKLCADVVERIIDLLNRKGESLNDGDLIINQIVKTDSSIRYNESEEYWAGIIIFDVVTNDD